MIPILPAELNLIAPQVTLAQLLPQLAWDAMARGPLLVVAPAEARTTAPLPEPPRTGYNPNAIAPLFDLALVHYPGLSVLGPNHSLTLAAAAPPGNAFADSYAARYLLATLSEAQLRKLGKEGLSRSELAPGLQPFFDGVLPDIVTLPYSRLVPPADDDLLLTPTAAAGIRLRLRTSLLVELLHPTQKPRQGMSFIDSDPADEGEPKGRTVRLRPGGDFSEKAITATKGPWHRKPDTLPIAMGTVSLVGAETVAALVDRLAALTGLTLYVDPRFGSLPVAVWGTTAPATALATALCRALNGTWRALGDSHLLTEDQVGLAQRLRALRQPKQLRRLARRQLRNRAEAMISTASRRRAFLPLAEITRSELRSLPELFWKASLPNGEATQPLDSLPATLRAEPLRRWRSEYPGAPLPNRYHSEVLVFLEVVVPALGGAQPIFTFTADEFRETPPAPPPPPLTLPATLAHRVALLPPPQDEKERETLVALARTRALTALWLTLPREPNPESEAQLPELGKALAASHCGLVLTIAPLEARPSDPAEARTHDLDGRSAHDWATQPHLRQWVKDLPELDVIVAHCAARDYLQPERVALGALTARLTALAQLPGVTGIALTDLAPPGLGYVPLYEPPHDWEESSELQPAAFWSGGFDPDTTRAFLQAQHADPLDLDTVDAQGLFFAAPRFTPLWSAWRRASGQRLTDFFSRLRTALTPLATTTPIWVAVGPPLGPTIWRRWYPQTPLPLQGLSTNDTSALQKPLQSLSYGEWLLSYRTLRPEWTDAQEWRATLAQSIPKPHPDDHTIAFDGVVLDLSCLPHSAAVRTLGETLATRATR